MITGMTWRALKFLFIVVLVVLYSRIVYALWFKRVRSDGELTHQQQVRLQALHRVLSLAVFQSAMYQKIDKKMLANFDHS